MSARRAWRYDRRDRWRQALLASPHFHPTHKLILAATQARMKPDGKFEVERREVMALAGVKHPQRVTEAWSRAVRYGYLVLVTKMPYGKPSRYQATFPDLGCDETCTRDDHRLSPPVVTASPGHYGHPSAEAVTTGKLTPPVVTGKPVTIPTGAAPAVPPTHSASPSNVADLKEQQLLERDLPSLIRLTAERLAWPDDEETGT